MKVKIVAYGQKHGTPDGHFDQMYDCRRLANPHSVPHLRPLSGMDPRVRQWVMCESGAKKMVDHFVDGANASGLDEAAVAVSCFGGRHRSVAIAMEIAERLLAEGHTVVLTFRDADKW